jgi:hypothetical protein
MTNSSTHFFSKTEATQTIWLTHYSLQLLVNGPICLINNEEIVQTQADIVCYIFILHQLHPVSEYSLTVALGLESRQVRIDFTKYGHEGIWIESRINGGERAFLAIDTIKPYLDERPLAPGNKHETSEYRLRWWDKSIAHGEWTGIQKAVLGV